MSTPVILNVVPIPINDPIAALARAEFIARKTKDPNENKVTQPWVDFFTQFGDSQALAPTRVGGTSLTAQAASISPTDISNGALSAGLYTVEFYWQITQVATVSSSLSVTLDWTNAGQAESFTSPALTTNTLQTFQSGPVGMSGLIHVDGLTPVRISTTYASVGATPMQYQIFAVLSAVNV